MASVPGNILAPRVAVFCRSNSVDKNGAKPLILVAAEMRTKSVNTVSSRHDQNLPLIEVRRVAVDCGATWKSTADEFTSQGINQRAFSTSAYC